VNVSATGMVDEFRNGRSLQRVARPEESRKEGKLSSADVGLRVVR
jgi:hypothetical protein